MSVDNAAFRDFRESLERLGIDTPSEVISDEERVRRAKQTFMDKLDGRMAVDLTTCVHCGMCAEACHFYEATQDEKYAPVHKFEPLRRFYRRELSPMRWLFRPFTRDITAQDLETWQELVYDACTGCGRCDMMCPMGIRLSTLINVMRQGLASAGLVPAELQALQNEQRDSDTVFGVGAGKLREVIDRLGRQGIEIPLDKDQAEVLVLTTAVEVLLFSDALAATAKILNRLGADWTMLSQGFEAANIGLVSGDEVTQKRATAKIVEQAKACGARTVILPESGHAYQALRWEGANVLGEVLPFEVLAMSEFIAREIDAGRLKLKSPANGSSVTYHDPCRLGRHGGVIEQPRQVLKALGLDFREADSNGRENFCCGGGCGEYVIKRSAPLRQKAFEIKKREFDETGADTVITSCANCRINLMIGADNAGWQKPVESLVEKVAASLAE
ncbi:MAG: (Fe-S)-binding protein [Proteobacteria bacterium]|nr:(Fe-S)-binding protein [Pseudomonadota bacterium]